MYIVVVGAGEVGRYLTGILILEGHDVAVIEADDALARELDGALDALVIHGSGVDQQVLLRAGIEKAELVLAVTAIDEVNLIACVVAHRSASNVRTVARVRGTEYMASKAAITAENLGLDLLVGPERAIARKVRDLLQYSGAGGMRTVGHGWLRLLELPLGPDSPFVHERLADLAEVLGDASRVCAVLGDDGVRIPKGDDRLQVHERALILTKPDHVDMFMILSGKPWHNVGHVLIVGCGTIGFHLAEVLQRDNFSVTVIESDGERAEWVAQRLPHCEVLKGDGTDPELLREELSERADAVVVLLEDDEKALLVGVFAKHLGAKKVIVRSDKSAYAPIGRKLGIDALISPKRAVADAILHFVHRGDIEDVQTLGGGEAEMVEYHVREGAKIVGRPLAEVEFPEGSLVGAVIRGDDVTIATGNTVLEAGDDVLVVALASAVQKVEELLT